MKLSDEIKRFEKEAKISMEKGRMELSSYYIGVADGLRHAKFLYKASEVSVDDDSTKNL